MDPSLQPPHEGSSRLRIGVADDHSGFRGAVVSWLRQAFGFEVVEAAGTDPSALASLQVDLLLLGAGVRKLLDLDLVRHIKSSAIASRVIVMSGSAPNPAERILLERGADAIVHKQTLAAELPALLTDVLGEPALP